MSFFGLRQAYVTKEKGDIAMTTTTAMGQKLVRVSIVLLALALAIPGGSFAKIPEPDNIVYGVARDDAVTIRLKVNSEEICSYTMGDNPEAGVFYVLRVPMDSVDPVEPGTARPGDTADIYINNAGSPVQSVILGERGSIHRLDLGTTDVDTDDIPDQWEQQIINANPNDDIDFPYQVEPADDFDNDGFSNLREYLAGSHPVDTEKIPCCWADVFLDGDVDGEDLAIFTEEFGNFFGYYCPECTFNMDGDDDIDEWDFLFFCEDYGRTNCR
jgi:hypothetical protein